MIEVDDLQIDNLLRLIRFVRVVMLGGRFVVYWERILCHEAQRRECCRMGVCVR